MALKTTATKKPAAKKAVKKDVIKSTFGEDFVDLYIKIGKKAISNKSQFRRLFSELYHCEEYVWQGEIKQDSSIKFVRGDKRELPNTLASSQISGPGVTLSGGNACADFKVEKALVCPVEGSDLIYNFVDEDSSIKYIGKTKVVTLFIRIYDNNTGDNNDRWLVISAE